MFIPCTALYFILHLSYTLKKGHFENKPFIHSFIHRITCMYFNFQHYRVSRSVKTVHTKLFEKNRYLLKFVTTNINFEKKMIISDMSHRKTYMYNNFEQTRVS